MCFISLRYEDDLRFALKVGCLAFDSTRISAADVDYPIDVVIYSKARMPRRAICAPARWQMALHGKHRPEWKY
jgi:hypothetical protein